MIQTRKLLMDRVNTSIILNTKPEVAIRTSVSQHGSKGDTKGVKGIKSILNANMLKKLSIFKTEAKFSALTFNKKFQNNKT
ncbi:hypothetical protein T11_10033 [Trichinella zimbabwensis]|uniref:Uncharacterized protein n=1 Tax=Trichinella zimbabwensis TaxID=268475 RepID=A0A0V1HYJ9_9BILA|nr:hypothetical protein T11_10033 [Trichinella zimbabwensis]